MGSFFCTRTKGYRPMYFKEIFTWGIVPVLLLAVLAVVVLWVVDRRVMVKFLSVSFRWPFWRLPFPLLLVLFVAVLAGSVALAGCLMLCLPCRMFLPVAAVLLVSQLLTVPSSFCVYLRSLRHTVSHRRYLQANGATHLEAVMSCVRRALRAAVLPLCVGRPLVVGLLLLFFGLYMGSASMAAALLMTMLLWGAMLAASVLSAVLLMWMSDHLLFDRQGNLKSANIKI